MGLQDSITLLILHNSIMETMLNGANIGATMRGVMETKVVDDHGLMGVGGDVNGRKNEVVAMFETGLSVNNKVGLF